MANLVRPTNAFLKISTEFPCLCRVLNGDIFAERHSTQQPTYCGQASQQGPRMSARAKHLSKGQQEVVMKLIAM
jgi:hypothetical protein